MGAETGLALTWAQRVKIELGAAQRLAYLHEGTHRPVIIIRDLKASNILLDHVSPPSPPSPQPPRVGLPLTPLPTPSQYFTAKLSDFGLARDGPAGDDTHVSAKVVGTYGYTAPEYMQTGHLTPKSDVYAF